MMEDTNMKIPDEFNLKYELMRRVSWLLPRWVIYFCAAKVFYLCCEDSSIESSEVKYVQALEAYRRWNNGN